MLRRCLALAVAAALAGCATSPSHTPAAMSDGLRADVAILETTDLHTHVLSYDYDRQRADDSFGFERVATLIRQARAESQNDLLFDDGDTIQGTALADFQAQGNPLRCDEKLAMFKAMDAVGFDAGTIGNHEFNYGLPFLSKATGTVFNVDGADATRCTGPSYPLVLSNVFSARDGKPLFAPYTVVSKTFTAYTPDGSRVSVPMKIGVLGFAPTPIMKWDKVNLEGKVTVQGMVEAAQRWLPELRAQGVDLVVAVAHTGINPAPYTTDLENVGWHLAGVEGIDALLLGHSHRVFPGADDANSGYGKMPEVDNQKGFIRGVPAVMGGFYGQDLGVIKLGLVRKDGRWQVDRERTHSEVRPVRGSDGKAVDADPAIAKLVEAEHSATVAWLETPIGRSDRALSTVFAEEGDVSALGVVNAAQSDFAAKWIKQHRPDLTKVPVLSAAAAFKTGFAGPDDYTDVTPGPISLRSANDLYLYPNTIAAVLIDGDTLKAWLERSAQRFNQIDPASSAAQPLISKKLPGYNFDVLQGGLSYTIDVTKPIGERIGALKQGGKPVTSVQRFIVATNNYRSTDNAIPGLQKSEVLFSGLDENRAVVIAYLRSHSPLPKTDAFSTTPWHFAPAKLAGSVTVPGPPGHLGRGKAFGVTKEEPGEKPGFATYTVQLPQR